MDFIFQKLGETGRKAKGYWKTKSTLQEKLAPRERDGKPAFMNDSSVETGDGLLQAGWREPSCTRTTRHQQPPPSRPQALSIGSALKKKKKKCQETGGEQYLYTNVKKQKTAAMSQIIICLKALPRESGHSYRKNKQEHLPAYSHASLLAS